MKKRPVLISAIILTMLLEKILIILVYNKVGEVRLPYQIGRLAIQLIFILWILNNKTRVGLFLLSSYHIITGLLGIYSQDSQEIFGQILIGFHITIGLVIYFHDWIEYKIGINKLD